MAKKTKGSRVTPKGTHPLGYVEKEKHVHDENCAHGTPEHSGNDHAHGGHSQQGGARPQADRGRRGDG